MGDFIIQIPGPLFLLYFAIFSIATIWAGWQIINTEESHKYPLPQPTHFSAYDIAGVYGGFPIFIQTVIFSLWRRNFIKMSEEDDFKIIVVNTVQSLTTIEKEVCHQLDSINRPGELLRYRPLRRLVKKYIRQIYSKFQQSYLVYGNLHIIRNWIVIIAAFSLISVIGGFKLYQGLMREKPVLFLLVLIFVSLISVVRILKPVTAITPLGERYFALLRDHFGSARDAPGKRQGAVPQNPSPDSATGVPSWGPGATNHPLYGRGELLPFLQSRIDFPSLAYRQI